MSGLGAVPSPYAKNPKRKVGLLTEFRLAQEITDQSTSSNDLVVPMGSTCKMTKQCNVTNDYDGYAREYIYTK